MASFAWRFYFERSGPAARRVFIASLAYLPLLLVLMIASVRHEPETQYVRAEELAAPVVQAAHAGQ
jgi:heme O synthase-like polyprenyltransferase